MRSSTHDGTFRLDEHFPSKRFLRGWEGTSAYAAEKDGKFYVLYNNMTLADFLDEDKPTDAVVLGRLVSVLEFDTAAERQRYMRANHLLPLRPRQNGMVE